MAAGANAPTRIGGPPACTGFWVNLCGGDLVEATAKRHRIRSPDRPQGRDELLKPGPAPRRRDVRRQELIVRPPLTQADDETAVTESVQAGEASAQDDGDVEKGVDDASAKLDALGFGRDVGQGFDRVVDGSVRLGDRLAGHAPVAGARVEWTQQPLLDPD
jgi:hypothetical protein